jgi:hypothetical protein
VKIDILLITLSLGLGLVTTIARAQSAPSVITPTFTTTTTAGHTSFGIGPISTFDPAYSDATAFTTGHYTSSGRCYGGNVLGNHIYVRFDLNSDICERQL